MYRLTSAASSDMVSIYMTGIDLFGREQAESYLDALEHTFDLIARNPNMGRERKDIEPPTYIHPHGSHIIVYDVDQNREVLILRIRHAHEDWIENPIN